MTMPTRTTTPSGRVIVRHIGGDTPWMWIRADRPDLRAWGFHTMAGAIENAKWMNGDLPVEIEVAGVAP